jgi:peptide/nickel transport system substrate-binding protein
MVVAAACGGGSEASDSDARPTTPAVDSTPGATATEQVSPDQPEDSAAATSAAPAEPSAVQPVVGGKIVAALEAETSQPWVPAEMSCANGCSIAGRSFYETLFSIDTDLNLVPNLATGFTENEDGTVHTITLREGVTFSDGEPFNAAAVVDNINRYRASFLVGKALEGITDVKEIDDVTVEITLRDSYFDLAYVFANAQPGFMASPTWLAAADADPNLKARPVGTGPFIVDSYAPGQSMVVKRNPTYWKKDANGVQLPYLDEIEFRIVVDDLARRNAMDSGDLDIANTQSGETIMDFESNSDLVTVATYSYTDTNYLLMKLTPDSPFANKNLRCGVLYGLDQEAAKEALAGGFDLPLANGMFAPGQDGYLEDNGYSGYDPEKAQAFIDAWKAETNGGSTIKFTTVPDQQALATAEFFQADLEELGVDVEILQTEQGKLITDALTGSPDFHVFTWRNHSGFRSDDKYIWWHSSLAVDPPGLALNFARLKDPKVDGWLDENRAARTSEDRKRLSEEMNSYFVEECLIVPQYWTPWMIAHQTNIGGVDYVNVDGSIELKRTGIYNPGQLFKIDG